MSTTLTIPVFDPVGAVRAIVHGWILPSLGGAAAFVASPLFLPWIRETVSLIGAKDAGEVARCIAGIERRNRVRAYPAMAAALVWAGARVHKREESRADSQRTIQRFFAWWDQEREKSSAPPELLSRLDVALYSLSRSAIRVLSGQVSPREKVWPRELARGITSMQVLLAALIGGLLFGRDGAKLTPSAAALEALIERTERDADTLARLLARDAP